MITACDEVHVARFCTLFLSILSPVVRLLLLSCLLTPPPCDGLRVPGVPHIARLKREAEDLFYHGFDNYMLHAFPEDELRPVSCAPLTRDRDPTHIEVNDALGNYSLTLIDSLSTLAVLASSPCDVEHRNPLALFQNAVKDVVEQYGDGTAGPGGQGRRARGFALDSKVQVFETTIRGVGGLLSAHLFAVGDLPIRGYDPQAARTDRVRAQNTIHTSEQEGIDWENGLVYDGQLLRLAHDLGQRLLPAFWTATGIPYPRVNLQYGTPFYVDSPDNYDPELGQCKSEQKGTGERTETCSAGAGSLVLEFTVLSRLTGDGRFEELAKRAFWAIWNRRSDIDLIGAPIDAETGIWQHSWTGVGAGIDSFFEYAYKSHILLAGHAITHDNRTRHARDPRKLHQPLTTYEQSSDAFRDVFDAAHAAIKRQIYRGPNFQHPHYVQVDVATGAARAFWIDALSAYYPGLLTLAGHVEEATATHLLFTALWARFSGIPERYNLATGGIEGGLGWWIGRPEFIESTWYLYRATEDPWYIYVGEMVLKDIQRRCWTRCGWAGVQNVLTGEKSDRMESFFLGETAKYLFLLFDPDHPLNKMDDSFVFSTEGHPLILPRECRIRRPHTGPINDTSHTENTHTCPVAPTMKPLTVSNVAARRDIYHAASLARFHLMPRLDDEGVPTVEYAADHPSLTLSDNSSASDYTVYPWTLPVQLTPNDATSSEMPSHPTFDLTFPTMANPGGLAPPLQRIKEGILVNFIGGLRLSMVQDVPRPNEVGDFNMAYRIQSINHVALGKDEKVFISRNIDHGVLDPSDPLFARTRDSVMLDLVVDLDQTSTQEVTAVPIIDSSQTAKSHHLESSDLPTLDNSFKEALSTLMTQIQNIVKDTQNLLGSTHLTPSGDLSTSQAMSRQLIAAITSTGLGSAPLLDWPEVSSNQTSREDLPWTKIYAASDLCSSKLPVSVPRNHQIILIRRGSCSFSRKLANIPSVAPGPQSLQLVVVVDHDHNHDHDHETHSGDETHLIRPLLDEPQRTPSGLDRPRGIPMVMVAGGEKVYDALRRARGIGIRRRWSVTCQGVPVDNLIVV